MGDDISYRIEVQEYIHRRNGEVETGKYSEFSGSVDEGKADNLMSIFRDIEHALFPPEKPFRRLRSTFAYADETLEGQRIVKRVYEVTAWTSVAGQQSWEIERRDLE